MADEMHCVRRRSTDAVHWFMAEQGARIVAESGQPCDRFHIGKHLLQGLKDAPDFIAQIDGGTGQSETNKSLMARSVRCAMAMKNLGLKAGDVIVVMAPNHIHLSVPVYAAMYIGVTVAALDITLTVGALSDVFSLCEPKLVFCQSERAEDMRKALQRFDDNTKIVLFNEGRFQLLDDFIEEFEGSSSVEDFIPSSLDPETAVSFLVFTSGTTGEPKFAQLTHKNMMIGFPYVWSKFSNFPGPTRMLFNPSGLNWISAIKGYICSPIFRITRLQTSMAVTPEHFLSLIQTNKPTYMILNARFFNNVTQPEIIGNCDFSCFEVILVGSCAVPEDLIERMRVISPHTNVYDGYGMTETSLLTLDPVDGPTGNIGIPLGSLEYRLIDIDAQEDITEPNKIGELWIKGPQVFKGYLKNPKATLKAFSEDGWFKTGDLMYRDETWKFYFKERLKLLLKYKIYKFYPVEMELTIGRHVGVADVAVTGVLSPDGECPVACVVLRPGHHLTAEDINQLVQDSLMVTKQIRIGVIFLDTLPTTCTGKIDRKKLKDIALQMPKD